MNFEFKSSFSLKKQELMGHGLLKKVNFYFIFSEKINFPGKIIIIMLNAFASLKCSKKS